MQKIAFFDVKPYDMPWFKRLGGHYDIRYFENKLCRDTASLASGCSGVIAFVNDTIDAAVIDALWRMGVRVLALRCCGFNNVDVRAAEGKLTILRVPAYSPHAIAEHAMGMLLTLNRKLHRAYLRTREFNFSLEGLTGMDLHGKTAGIIGTGRIGRAFISICRGFGMKILAYDPFPAKDADFPYVTLGELYAQSDVISLHCPLTKDTEQMIGQEALDKMKTGVFLLNTSRGELIDSRALLDALKDGKVQGAGLDVYEEESDLFFEDHSGKVMQDDILSLLIAQPNVLVTSHQAYLTEEALRGIAEITLQNLDDFFAGQALSNRICYNFRKNEACTRCQGMAGA